MSTLGRVLRASVDSGAASSRGGLTRRMAIASGLLTLVLVAGFMAVLLAIDNLRESTQSRRDIRRELVAANGLRTLVIDLETGVRGFVIARDDRFLDPWRDARAAFPEQARSLERLVTDEPVQLGRLRRIEEDVASYIHEYALPLLEAARRSDPSASSVGATAEGKRRIDAIRAAFDAFVAAGNRTLATRERSADSAARLAVVGAGTGAAGSILLILLFAGYLTRAIVRPVRRAAVMAGRLAGGDLGTRMPETGVGEIRALERSFNTMGSSLEQSRDELRELAGEQAALRRVATLVARGVSPAEVFSAVAEELALLLKADMTKLLRYEPDGDATVVGGWGGPGKHVPIGIRLTVEGDDIAESVLRTGLPGRTASFDGPPGSIAASFRDEGARSGVGSPILVEARLWGVAIAASSQPDPHPAGGEARMKDFAELVAMAIANAESRADLTASRARIVTTADETRRRIERDLHDGAQQRLVSLALELRAAQATVPPVLGGLKDELSRVAEGLASALHELRETARGIHPAILAEGGLEPALKTLALRSPIPVEVDVRSEARLSEPVEVATYFVVSEALTNAAKHASASVVHVGVESVNGVLRVSIQDDGSGGADSTRGSGLVGLKDRVEALGGALTVQSLPGAGTTVHAELPLGDQ